ncbi:dicarboxylate/amino acid:cation symporter [Tessaracoccus rhinocerotis]|uniref:Dicarboxylate/amino acid:cation symporter n=1 Tax=Tessaracoccus rhinocerotis TaxID=1689449 RepID=A0A553JZF2_9ACTN|nr:dicarboxylate/amino acid:cation symporter [Tessaracoccus rhinocerotis]TRY17835.1 dicarboxylate/amino acid:cation symporter [Tessaracoccus rhinocerotis]
MARLPKFNLLVWVVIAIALGIALGSFLPEVVVRLFITFNGLFGNFLGFIIPLLIVGLITPAIDELGKGAGKWLAVTAGIAYTSSVIAGLLSWGTSMIAWPRLLTGNDVSELADPESGLVTPFFTVDMPPMFQVMTALVFAFVVGIALTRFDAPALHQVFADFREVINIVISKVIVPLLPLYIFGIFMNMTFAGQIWQVIQAFFWVVLIVFLLTVAYIVIQYAVAGAITKKNPFRLIRAMLPAYATALGTSSSAATIPVTLRSAIKAGVSENVASFVIPLGATIHLAGSTIKITGFALAIMVMFGMEIPPAAIFGFILLLGIAMVAAPGVPGGAIVTAAALLETQLGFSPEQVGLMIATYIAIDSIGTAANVTGDGAIAVIVDKLAGHPGHRDLGLHLPEELEPEPDPA